MEGGHQEVESHGTGGARAGGARAGGGAKPEVDSHGWRMDTERLEAMEPVVPELKQLYPKKGDHIKYFVDGEWKKVEVTSKGGRSMGKNKSTST